MSLAFLKAGHLIAHEMQQSSFSPDKAIIRTYASVLIIQGHPTTIFGRISVGQTIFDLEFSEHLL